MHVLVTYHSPTGNTKRLAGRIADGVCSVDGIDCVLMPVADVGIDDVLAAEGLIAGLPSYSGTMAAEMKRLFDRVISGNRDKTARRTGAAFATSVHPTGGLETAMLSILQAMLVAGFVVVGDPRSAGGHYGVGCAGASDECGVGRAMEHGRQVAELVMGRAG